MNALLLQVKAFGLSMWPGLVSFKENRWSMTTSMPTKFII